MLSGDATLGVGEQLKVLEEVIQKLILRDFVTHPQQCKKSVEIKSHLEELENYFKLCKINNDENKVAILFNSITDDMRLEIRCQMEYGGHENDYGWISAKLVELFHPKESGITPLVKLFCIKQKSHQSLREFLSEIRIEGYKLLKSMHPEEREKHLIDAFSKGLRNEELKAALGRIEVGTLEEAYRLIKKEKSATEESQMRQMGLSDDNATLNEVRTLKREVAVLQKQLESIVTILQGIKTLQKPSYAEMTRKRNNEAVNINHEEYMRQGRRRGQMESKPQTPIIRDMRRQVVQCWTCGENGHISRFCSMNKCNNCGRKGHTAWNCRISGRPQNIRQLHEDSWSSDCEPHVYDDSDQPDFNSEAEENREEADHVNVLATAEVDKQQCHKRRNQKQAMQKRVQTVHYPDYINEMYEYIQGNRSKKNTRFEENETLITESHSEKARNKPLVRGLCHGRSAKIFLDTGAEINVIDKTFVTQLSREDSFIRINRASKVIRCANNSRLNVEGWTHIRVSVAGLQRKCKFWVIDNLFPKVILGIRAMKDFSIMVDPGKGCIRVGNTSVPFLSSIQSQSVIDQSSGNGEKPGL